MTLFTVGKAQLPTDAIPIVQWIFGSVGVIIRVGVTRKYLHLLKEKNGLTWYKVSVRSYRVARRSLSALLCL